MSEQSGRSGLDKQVSVIIPVGPNDHLHIERQLRQLDRQITARDFEVIVCDNGSGFHYDPASTTLDVTVVDASAVRGSSYARNIGVASAEGDHLLFCDADDLAGPGWVEAHATALETTAFSVGAVLTVDASDARIDRVARHAEWPEDGFSSDLMRHEGIAIASGCNLAVRRVALERVGGFPLEYLRSQDVALSLALRDSGATPQFTPGARVMYVVGARDRRRELRNRYETGIARVRLRSDFHVGPLPTTITVRALGRTGRAIVRRLRRRDLGRPPSSEAAEFLGCLVETARLALRRLNLR